jgi:hypothetical protein
MGITDNHRETLYVTDQITGQPMPVDGDSSTGAIKVFGVVTPTIPAGAATEAKQDVNIATIQDLYNQLSLALDRLEFGNLTDNAKRLKVVPEQATAANLNATVAIAATQTLATVSTVSSVTNTARQGDLQMQRVNEALLDTAFITGITNHITF